MQSYDLGRAEKNLSLHGKHSLRKVEKEEENAIEPLVHVIIFRGLRSWATPNEWGKVMLKSLFNGSTGHGNSCDNFVGKKSILSGMKQKQEEKVKGWSSEKRVWCPQFCTFWQVQPPPQAPGHRGKSTVGKGYKSQTQSTASAAAFPEHQQHQDTQKTIYRGWHFELKMTCI